MNGDLWVLLWSHSRNSVEVRRLDDVLQAGRAAYRDNAPGSDWTALYVGTKATVEASAGFCGATLFDRMPAATERQPIEEPQA